VSETLNSNIPHFCYKYVIVENEQPIIWEQGYDRIADLAGAPEISKGNKEFIEKQNQILAKNLRTNVKV
jgi:hypothetical protein